MGATVAASFVGRRQLRPGGWSERATVATRGDRARQQAAGRPWHPARMVQGKRTERAVQAKRASCAEEEQDEYFFISKVIGVVIFRDAVGLVQIF